MKTPNQSDKHTPGRPTFGRNEFPGFIFDGRGINGRDSYRTRLATLTEAGLAEAVGPMFAAAPELLKAASLLAGHVEDFLQLGKDATWADAESLAKIYSISGCELALLGRKSAQEVFARRVCDGAIRTYFNSQLRCEGGAKQIEAVLSVLPKTTLKRIKS